MVFPAVARRVAAVAAAAQQQQQRVSRSALRSAIATSFPRVAPATSSRGVSSLAPPSSQLPQHLTGDVTGVVAGVAIVGAIVGVGKMWWDASSSPAAGGRSPAAFQELSQAEVAGFFRELLAQVQQLFKQIPEIESAMRSYMKSNGMELDDAQFKQALMQQLFQMMEALEQEVVGKRQWSRQTIEAAFEKFADDAEVTALQQELQQVMQSVFPPPEPVEIPAHLTAEKTLEIFRGLVSGMETALREMLSHAKSEGITDANQAMQEFQHLYIEHVEQITTALLKTHGITQEIFTVALQQAIQENESLRAQVEQIYATQAKTFRNLGLKVDEP